MNNQEKETFSQVLATLFYTPDEELAKQIRQRTLYSFFRKYVQSWRGAEGLLKGFLMEGEVEDFLEELKAEHDRLFSGLSEESISLVESFYKPWTRDARCPLPFASERGLLMGDSAVHLLAIYQQCGLEVSEEFKSCPDHIVMELEFLSYLYERATDIEVQTFIEDHLDWVPLLKHNFERLHAHPFYLSALEVLNLFLNRERERLEVEANGKKKIL
ncbi:MAG TPA: molecular chaperone TorD family protein [Thermodesulfobacteriota bacterium]|nr:molecular chaperone TorD family protein [Thermodesulfobacteriota bacterium]